MDLETLPVISVAETLTLKPGIADLWYYFYEDTTDPALLAAHEALMTPDERQRHQRFHFEKDRRMFLATRALVRTTLSAYAGVPPADWRFTAGQYGKPRIELPNVTPPIHFNLANTSGLVVCAVSIAHESIGVDTERIDRKVEVLKLADRFFSPSEAAAIQHLATESGQLDRFFTYWTLKESYIKARGLGLALPLDQFSFGAVDAKAADDVSIRFDPELPDDPAAWRFAVVNSSTNHRIGVGARTDGVPLSLRAGRVVPLAAARPTL